MANMIYTLTLKNGDTKTIDAQLVHEWANNSGMRIGRTFKTRLGDLQTYVNLVLRQNLILVDWSLDDSE